MHEGPMLGAKEAGVSARKVTVQRAVSPRHLTAAAIGQLTAEDRCCGRFEESLVGCPRGMCHSTKAQWLCLPCAGDAQ